MWMPFVVFHRIYKIFDRIYMFILKTSC